MSIASGITDSKEIILDMCREFVTHASHIISKLRISYLLYTQLGIGRQVLMSPAYHQHVSLCRC